MTHQPRKWFGRPHLLPSTAAGAMVALGVGIVIATTIRQPAVQAAEPDPSPTTVEQAQSYAGVGARVEPAGLAEVPTVSSTKAAQLLGSADLAKTLIGTSSPSKLLLVQYENQFGTQQPNGSETPSVPKQLAWLAEYTNVHVSDGPQPANATTPSRSWNCTYYIAMSASTGAVLDAFDYCT